MCLCVCVHACIHASLYVHTRMCVCVHIYAHTHFNAMRLYTQYTVQPFSKHMINLPRHTNTCDHNRGMAELMWEYLDNYGHYGLLFMCTSIQSTATNYILTYSWILWYFTKRFLSVEVAC